MQLVLPNIRFDRSYWMVTHQDLRSLARIRAAMDHIVEEVRANREMFQVDASGT